RLGCPQAGARRPRRRKGRGIRARGRLRDRHRLRPARAPPGAARMRVGVGVDAHALVEGVPLVLGGVPIDHERGLASHSDGDVISHALIDAILGAAGLGDIGSLFPSDSTEWEGASSPDLPARAYAQVTGVGLSLAN